MGLESGIILMPIYIPKDNTNHRDKCNTLK